MMKINMNIIQDIVTYNHKQYNISTLVDSRQCIYLLRISVMIPKTSIEISTRVNLRCS